MKVTIDDTLMLSTTVYVLWLHLNSLEGFRMKLKKT